MSRVAALSAVLLAVFVVAPALAQDEEAPTPSEEATTFAKDFKKNFKKLPEGEVLEGIDKLVAYYNNKKVDEKKAKKAILEGLAKAAFTRNTVVVVRVVQKCGEMDDEALKILLPVLMKELKKKEPEEDIYESAMESLGKLALQDPGAIKTLKDLLKNKDHAVVARAARALGMYGKSPGRIRKDLFEEILKQSEGVYSSAQSGSDQNSERKWNIIGDDVMEALHTLSQPPRPDNVKFNNPTPARKWYNDNKKARWEPKK